jgi:hypothetical protein
MAARQPAGQTQRPFGQPPCYSLRTRRHEATYGCHPNRSGTTLARRLLPPVKKAVIAHELNERYPALSTTPRRARGHVAACLTAAERSDLIPSATLIVSELVTNAVVHAGGMIHMRVAVTDESLRVDIHDTSNLLPHLRQPDVGGRGLHIVNAIATNWASPPTATARPRGSNSASLPPSALTHLSLMPGVLPRILRAWPWRTSGA